MRDVSSRAAAGQRLLLVDGLNPQRVAARRMGVEIGGGSPKIPYNQASRGDHGDAAEYPV